MLWIVTFLLLAMGASVDEILRTRVLVLRLPEHPKDIREGPTPEVLYFYLRRFSGHPFPGRDDSEDFFERLL